MPSGFIKRPVPGPVAVTRNGIEGDEQGDLRVHGGRDKAVYGYAAEAYDYWHTAQPQHAERLGPGAMGENLTIAGFDEKTVHIGDKVRIGTALLEVTEPRQPCFKLALAFDDPRLVRTFTRAGRCGWYYRTLEPGLIATGDTCECIDRPNPAWTVARLFEVIMARAFSPDTLAEMVAIEGLAEGWKLKALSGLALLRRD
ncbi:MOSC domain-containing protein [Polymorphobacter sp. PAMC 29334]|uniref:MOSC domain-containing protein n=1 Tax=Polymorphobacter sp. PAMC 29334 TaxID=2862331 RepID=UPI001C68490E|nr:MOSC domain-containing protein [Polymorphobacter sp. PAMC 29334]QYE34064.1 MOSC domain-containing protein [Polymorphobacter sp. PAMC 29334]